jgi:riboflavin kinase/FMN adenylyltransferase
MVVAHGLDEFSAAAGGVVLSIGNFDGVHAGHREIVRRAQEVAGRLGVPVVAMTFDPHPLEVLAPERAPEPLTTAVEKLGLLERLGVATTIVLRSDRDLLAQEAADFLARVVTHCRPRAFVEGHDFNFGRGRVGSVDTLRQYAERWQYEVHVVEPVRCAALDTHPRVSSSSIRQALRDGRVGDANLMLGRLYRLAGRVGEGVGRGAGLGIPTANLDAVAQMIPQEAVYAAVAQLADGSLHLAAVNIGPQPTFDSDYSRIEAFVLDYGGNLRGQPLGLHFIERIREQQKFASADELVAQVHRDVARTREHVGLVEQLRADGPLPL